MGIFISYSHSDAAAVRQVVDLLNRHSGHTVWYDNELRGGDHYFSVIAEQILENEYFIFAVSQSSVKSEWCIQELQFAMSEKRKIIAVWLEDTQIPPGIRLIIQNTHYLNWGGSDSAAFAKNIERCFSGNFVQGSEQSSGSDDQTSSRLGEKYFIVAEDVRQIEKLLKLEANNTYSECFKPRNAVLLGLAYELGIKTDTDLLKAEFYYKVGMFKGDGDAKYLYSALMAAKDPDNLGKYVDSMREAAEAGSVFAMTYFGDACYDGAYGMEKDIDTAVTWWRSAAEAGFPVAQYYMAYAHRWGYSVEKDYGLSLMYALSSMEHGFPRAYRILGLMYEYGEFVEKDLEKAREHYEKAISIGDPLSVHYLSGIYYFDYKDYDKSIVLIREAVGYADEGKIKSGNPYYRYALSLEYGRGTEKDLEEALKYYFKAVERSHKDAKKYVAPTIFELEDKEKKRELLVRAAGYDCTDAEWYLGRLCIEGFDGDTSAPAHDDAIEWYAKGAEKGWVKCIKELIGYYSWVFKGTRPNREEALKYYQLLFSISGTDAESLRKNIDSLSVYYYAFGVELFYDDDGKPDYPMAVHYFQRSIEEDDSMLPRTVGILQRFLESNKKGGLHSRTVEECAEFLELAADHAREIMKTVADGGTPEHPIEGQTLGELNDVFSTLSLMYMTGKSVQKNKVTAEKYEKLSAEFLTLKRTYFQ